MKQRVDLSRPGGQQLTAAALLAASIPGNAAAQAGEWALLAERDVGLVQRFYLSLSAAARRARFGGDASDEGIQRYCADLDWSRTIMVAGGLSAGVRALVEVRAATDDWERAVVILSASLQTGVERAARRPVLANLVQLAIFAAGQRGCNRFAFRMDPLTWDVMPLLTGASSNDIGERLSEILLGMAASSKGKRRAAEPLQPAL